MLYANAGQNPDNALIHNALTLACEDINPQPAGLIFGNTLKNFEGKLLPKTICFWRGFSLIQVGGLYAGKQRLARRTH